MSSSMFNEEIWLQEIRKIVVAGLSYGRCFVTLNKENNPVVYDALDAPNWRENQYINLLEVKEGSQENVDYSDSREYVRISHDGVNTTAYERFDSSGIKLEHKTTTRFKKIPVVCIGATNLDWSVDLLPLEGVATCALHIYKKSADLSYSEFSSCVPTLVMTGVEDSAANRAIGGGVALSIPNELAKVFYPQTDTNALQHVKIHIDALFDEAKTYGASLLGGDKTEVESAEAIRLRQAASGASLSTLTRTIERGINQLLEIAGIDTKFKINFNLEENYLTPAEQSTLLDAWMNNSISYTTYFNNLQKAGIVEDERSMEAEIAEIQKEKEKKAEEAMKVMEETSKINAKNDIVTDKAVSSSKVKADGRVPDPGKPPQNPSSPGRTKNMNREGADYEKQGKLK